MWSTGSSSAHAGKAGEWSLEGELEFDNVNLSNFYAVYSC